MSVRILTGDCRELLATLPDASVHCVVTSPPYFGLRDYGVAGQIGLEATPAEYVAEMVSVFAEVRRVLRDDGTLWLNLGDSYAGSWGAQGRQGETGQMATRSVVQARSIHAHPQKLTQTGKIRESGLKPKDLIGIPWRVAFALQADSWYLRQDIIWSKPACMPESVRDRCTKAHEYLFLLSKSERYHYDHKAILEPTASLNDSHPSYRPNSQHIARDGRREFQNKHEISARTYSEEGRNKRSVWTVNPQPFTGAHFAVFPPALIEPCILAGCPKGGTVLDPFGGAGTTGLVADRLGRNALLIEINPAYAEMARNRIQGDAPMFAQVTADSALCQPPTQEFSPSDAKEIP